eukprot:gb/GECH01008255.1/.p1 GENE.gb/GECH01008255.1/~~gb/GECH01008255.1/.p1  ORF type:complete len:539 (+),score=86.91 gb/GECH01008255.1/:1-1617(+)
MFRCSWLSLHHNSIPIRRPSCEAQQLHKPTTPNYDYFSTSTHKCLSPKASEANIQNNTTRIIAEQDAGRPGQSWQFHQHRSPPLPSYDDGSGHGSVGDMDDGDGDALRRRKMHVRRRKEHHTFIGLEDDLGTATVAWGKHPLVFTSRWLQHNIKVHFLPKGYPSSVSDEYIHYAKWQALQHVVGAMSGVLSTQSLLYAVGIGSGSIPLAAAINWVLKDGLGQLGGIIFASRVNVEFDADPKRWRFFGGMVLDVATGLEVMSPLFPSYFLPVASIANIGKNVAVLAGSATRATIHRSMCQRNNLGDVTGKAGSQAIATSLIGTGFGVLASLAIGSSFAAVFPSFLALSGMHLYCLYKSLNTVSIHTLNRQRIDIIVESYLRQEKVMTPYQVSKNERFVHLLAPQLLSERVRVNPRLDTAVRDIDHLTSLRNRFSDKKYMVSLYNDHVNLLVSKDAKFQDVIQGFLLAVITQQEWMAVEQSRPESKTSWEREESILELAQRKASNEYSNFVEELKDAGWSTSDYYIEPHGGRVLFKSNDN